jgi:rhamnosyltransferase
MLATIVIIPTRNDKKSLERILDSLECSISIFDTLIIDSDSSDGSLEVARLRIKNVFSIHGDEFNHGGTRQIMVDRNPDYCFYVFLTQDAILANQDSIDKIVKPFHDPLVGAVCGRQIPHNDASHLASHARIFNYPEESQVNSLEDSHRLGLKTAFLSNSFAAYRATALKDAGGFPDHVIFGEDMYVAARMLQKGWKIAYAADAKCLHSHNYTLVEEFRRYFDNGVFHARDPWIREMLGGTAGEGGRYVFSELRFLGWKRFYLWPLSLLRNAVKLIAFRMGLLERYLPDKLKHRFSMNQKFWMKSE